MLLCVGVTVHWIIHNFVRKQFHYSAQVPAVAMGILTAPLELQSILMIQT